MECGLKLSAALGLAPPRLAEEAIAAYGGLAADPDGGRLVSSRMYGRLKRLAARDGLEAGFFVRVGTAIACRLIEERGLRGGTLFDDIYRAAEADGRSVAGALVELVVRGFRALRDERV